MSSVLLERSSQMSSHFHPSISNNHHPSCPSHSNASIDDHTFDCPSMICSSIGSDEHHPPIRQTQKQTQRTNSIPESCRSNSIEHYRTKRGPCFTRIPERSTPLLKRLVSTISFETINIDQTSIGQCSSSIESNC
jgi:hypothetical protein